MKHERRMHKSKRRDLSNTRCLSTPWTSVPGIGPISASTPNSQGWLLAWPAWPVLSISQVVSPVFCLCSVQQSSFISLYPTPCQDGPSQSQHVVDASPAHPLSVGRPGNKLPSGPDPVACTWELERAINFPPLESPTEIHEASQKGEEITLIQ